MPGATWRPGRSSTWGSCRKRWGRSPLARGRRAAGTSRCLRKAHGRCEQGLSVCRGGVDGCPISQRSLGILHSSPVCISCCTTKAVERWLLHISCHFRGPCLVHSPAPTPHLSPPPTPPFCTTSSPFPPLPTLPSLAAGGPVPPGALPPGLPAPRVAADCAHAGEG